MTFKFANTVKQLTIITITTDDDIKALTEDAISIWARKSLKVLNNLIIEGFSFLFHFIKLQPSQIF